MQLVLPFLDDAPTRLRHAVPRALEIAERLGDDEPRLVGDQPQDLDLRMLLAQRVDACREEERARAPFARVAEGPDAVAVRRRHGHLERMLDTGAAADVLDVADGALYRTGRVVLEPHGEGEEEEDLRVRGALDPRIQARVDGENELALDERELSDQTVVHPQPVPVPERVAVRLLHRRAGGGADVREHEARAQVRRELAQVPLVPGGLDRVE